MDFISIITMSIVITGLIAFYAIGMYLNKKTPLPEECELPSLKCEHCKSTTCSYSDVNRIKKEIKESFRNNCEEGVLNE